MTIFKLRASFIILTAALVLSLTAPAQAKNGCPNGSIRPNLQSKCIAEDPTSSLPLDEMDPMQFEILDDGQRFIQATGQITYQTPDVFKAFLAATKDLPGEIHFDSPGGNLEPALDLGRAIRRARLTTTIGSAFKTVGGDLYQSPEPYCYSACAYAFLGGVTRRFKGETQYGVHRFSTEKATADDAQAETAMIATYLEEMGVKEMLLEIASTTSFEKINLIAPAEAESLRVIFDPNSTTTFKVERTSAGTPEASFEAFFNNRRFKGIVSCLAGGRDLELEVLDTDNATVALSIPASGEASLEDGSGKKLSAKAEFAQDVDEGDMALKLTLKADDLRDDAFEGEGLRLTAIKADGEDPAGVNEPDTFDRLGFLIKARNATDIMPLIAAPCRAGNL